MSISKSLRIITAAVNKHPLASKHKWSTYSRIIRWQLSQSLFPGLKKVPFVQHTFLLVKKGMTGATGNIYFGLHEFEDMGFMLHFLREEDCFADVGANIGSYTILASGVSGAETVSFEPVASTFESLIKNININGLQKRTYPKQAAAGGEHGTIKLTDGLDTVNHVLAAGEETSRYKEVEMTPVDDLLSIHNNIRLIKIDAEGFETEVLKGMTNMLGGNELKGIIIELNGSGERYGYSDKAIHDKLLRHGFKPFAYDPFTRILTAIDHYNTTNTIYLRDLPFVQSRLASAEKITVLNESF